MQAFSILIYMYMYLLFNNCIIKKIKRIRNVQQYQYIIHNVNIIS